MRRKKTKRNFRFNPASFLKQQWRCLRLNKSYRDFFDKHKMNAFSDVSEDDAEEAFSVRTHIFPDYRFKDLRRAVGAVYPKEDVDIYIKQIEVNGLFGKSDLIEISAHDHPTKFGCPGAYHLKFSVGASKQEVYRYVDRAFEEIEQNLKAHRLKMVNPKTSLLPQALDIYERVEYKGQSLRTIAKNERFSTETENAAYNRVKKKHKTAQRYVAQLWQKYL